MISFYLNVIINYFFTSDFDSQHTVYEFYVYTWRVEFFGSFFVCFHYSKGCLPKTVRKMLYSVWFSKFLTAENDLSSFNSELFGVF